METLPPLNAVRAFEAVARTGGVAAAAKSLFVTHGAVSKQIHLLEDHLGVRLFMREGRQLVLTDEGRRFAEQTQRAFAELRKGVEWVKRRANQTRLVVSVVPSFAARWLVPRLVRFQD